MAFEKDYEPKSEYERGAYDVLYALDRVSRDLFDMYVRNSRNDNPI